MAVDPEHLDALTATVVELYREAETALVRLIAKHLDDFPDAPPLHWAEQKLAAVRTLRRGAKAIADRLTSDSAAALTDAVAAAYRAGQQSAVASVRRFLPGLADALRGIDKHLPGFAAIEALTTAVHRDVGAKSSNILRDVEDAYRAVITAASVRTLAGANTRRQAAQAAWRRLVDRGITGFIDRSGRKWALSSYVEMATRTVTQRAAVTGETDRLGSLGVGLVYVSNAPQECQQCRPFEGRILSLDGTAGTVTVEHQLTGEPTTVHVEMSLVAARARGLFHPNCRHSVSAYLPGLTTLPTQPTADPKGDAARQRQREIERGIRKWKLRQAAALGPDTKKAAGQKVRAWQAEMRDHLNEHPGLRRLPYREKIGAGNIPDPGHHDPAGHIEKPPPPPEPPAPPVPPPPPPPKPGDSGLAQLLDVDDDTTLDSLTDKLADGTGTDDERAELATAVHRFDALATAGESGDHADGHAKFLAKLRKSADPTKYVRRRLGQIRTEEQRAATLRALWAELERRSRNRPPGMRHGRRWRDNPEAVAWAMDEIPVPWFKPDEYAAVRAYTGSSYSFINDGLRGWGTISDQHKFDRMVANLDAAFAQVALPEPLIVHRGVGAGVAKSMGANTSDAASMQALVGQVFTEKGFLSTSIGNRAAFSGDIYWMFRIPQGYPAMNGMKVSVFDTREREIIINRGARYVIHAVYRKNSRWFIEAEIVTDDWTPGPDWTPDPYGDAWEGYGYA